MVKYSSAELKAKIDKLVESKYKSWTIGITQLPKTRKKQHGNPETWIIWEANNLTAAQNTENYFLEKGMKGGTGGDLEDGFRTYVYIF